MNSLVGRSKLPIIGASFLVLVAVAVFLTLDLGSDAVTPSDLPVIRLAQVAATVDAACGRTVADTLSAEEAEELLTLAQEACALLLA